MTKPVLRWLDHDTGAIKDRDFKGIDRECMIHPDGTHERIDAEWESSALELALLFVPDLEEAIDRARMKGVGIEIEVRTK